MRLSWFLSLCLLVCFANIGTSIRCYRYEFSNVTGLSLNQYLNLSAISCPGPDEHLRCVNFRAQTTPDEQGKRRIMRWQQCAYSYNTMCRLPYEYCEFSNNTANFTLEKCQIGCCEGDLCNTPERPLPAAHAPVPKGPIAGADLTCYSCASKSLYGLHSLPTADCKNPVKKTCGYNPDFKTIKQDRCMTVTMEQNGTTKLIRECSDPVTCNRDIRCIYLNGSGTLKSCDVGCCYGNLCNGTTLLTTPLPSTPPTTTSQQSVVIPTLAALLMGVVITLLMQ